MNKKLLSILKKNKSLDDNISFDLCTEEHEKILLSSLFGLVIIVLGIITQSFKLKNIIRENN